jgi:hypothetical protein
VSKRQRKTRATTGYVAEIDHFGGALLSAKWLLKRLYRVSQNLSFLTDKLSLDVEKVLSDSPTKREIVTNDTTTFYMAEISTLQAQDWRQQSWQTRQLTALSQFW